MTTETFPQLWHTLNGRIVVHCVGDEAMNSWPAIQVATVLKDRIYAAHFFRLWNDRREGDDGNCREVALELIALLDRNGMSAGWFLCEGEVDCSSPSRPRAIHAWLECGEWAIDFSNGRSLIMPRNSFHNGQNATRIKRQTLGEYLRPYLKRQTTKGANHVNGKGFDRTPTEVLPGMPGRNCDV